MSTRSHEVVATFEDKYGETRTIHRGKNGLAIKQEVTTPSLAFNQPVAELIGKRIKKARIARGMTLVELAVRCGMRSGHPKNRIWGIENATRGEGIRLGTLYAIAIALDVEACELLPTNEEVMGLDLGVEIVPLHTLSKS